MDFSRSPSTSGTMPEAERDFDQVMRNVVIFVDFHYGKKNVSARLGQIIQAHGVRVCHSINDRTTHVVFKDGRHSTYQKAKELNIPVVSNEWFEACLYYNTICNPEKYQIPNFKLYDNPELFLSALGSNN